MNLLDINKAYFVPITKIMLKIKKEIYNITIDNEIEIIFSGVERDVNYFYSLLDKKEDNLLRLVYDILDDTIYGEKIYGLLRINELINHDAPVINVEENIDSIRYDITYWLISFIVQLKTVNRRITFTRLITLLLKYIEPEKVFLLKKRLTNCNYELSEILEQRYSNRDLEKLISEGPPKFKE